MIELLQGTPGSGKSYVAIRRIRWELSRRHYVITNIELSPDWPDRFVSRLLPRKKRLARMAEYRAHLHVAYDPDEIRRVRLPRCGKCYACRHQMKYCTREGRGLMVLDEAHKWLNPRGVDLDETSEELPTIAARERAAKKFRKRLVDFLALHRHHGLNVLLISQDEMNIDPQIRRLIEYNTKVRNLRRVKKLGIPIFPFTLFVAVTRWNDRTKSILQVNRYTLSTRIASAYHSMSVMDSDDGEEELIVLGGGPTRTLHPDTPEGFYRQLQIER